MARHRRAVHPPTFSSGRRTGPRRGKYAKLRFGITFAALMAAYYAVAEVPFFDRALLRFLEWDAAASSTLLNLLGQNTRINGTLIHSVRFAANLRRGCDAIEPAWFFAAAILSFPSPWSRKWAAIAAGTLIIGTVNLVRIVSLFLIGVYCPRAFEIVHLELWPAVFILLASGLWIMWLVWLNRTPAHVVP